MTTLDAAADADDPHIPAEQLPAAPIASPYGAGAAQLALAVGGLAIGTGEFASMGILPSVATDVGVSIPQAGHMISAYALGVVFGAPAITIAFARSPRRVLLVGLMAVFALGNLLSALASSYVSVVAARFIAGLPHGAYFGVAMLTAASLVPKTKRAQAASNVLLGLSIANVVGVPLATWLGQELGWRATFFTVTGLAILTAILVRIFTPEISAGEGASAKRELGAFRSAQVWLTLGVAAIGFGGMFAVYSYVTPTLTEVTGLDLSLVPLMLGLLGVGMIVGNVVGGRLADRALKATLVGALVWNGVTLGAFAFTSAVPWLAAVNLFLIGGCIAMGPALQTRLMDVAGEAQTLAAALNHSAFNLANALGAWLGGVAIAAGFGWTSPGLVGAVLACGGLAILWASFALEAKTGR